MRNLLIFTMAFMLSFSGLNAFAKDGAAEIPLTFSGYVHTATTYNLGDNEDESNNYHTFSDDDFTMTPSAQIGVSNDYFVIDALFGSLAEDLNDTDGEFFLHQAYGILPIGPWTAMVGHFDTMLGNEVINPGDNPNITRSFLFGYTINFQNTGIRAMIEPDMEFIDEFYIGVGNGWDTIYDEGENQEKTFEAAFGTTLGAASLFVAMNYGQETDDQTRQTYTAVFGMPLSDTLSLTLNGVMGKGEEECAYTSVVTGVADDGTWYGVGSYLTYEHDSTKSVTVRYIDFDHIDGKDFKAVGGDTAQVSSPKVDDSKVKSMVYDFSGIPEFHGPFILKSPMIKHDDIKLWQKKEFLDYL